MFFIMIIYFAKIEPSWTGENIIRSHETPKVWPKWAYFLGPNNSKVQKQAQKRSKTTQKINFDKSTVKSIPTLETDLNEYLGFTSTLWKAEAT